MRRETSAAMDKEAYLKNKIEEKYDTLAAFSRITGIPRTSILSMLQRGVETMSVGSFYTICQTLGISMDSILDAENETPAGEFIFCSEDELKLLKVYREDKVRADIIQKIVSLQVKKDPLK